MNAPGQSRQREDTTVAEEARRIGRGGDAGAADREKKVVTPADVGDGFTWANSDDVFQQFELLGGHPQVTGAQGGKSVAS